MIDVQKFVFQEFGVDFYSFSSTKDLISVKFKKNDCDIKLDIINDSIFINDVFDKILTKKWSVFSKNLNKSYCIHI